MGIFAVCEIWEKVAPGEARALYRDINGRIFNMLKIAATLSAAGLMLLACPLPSQSAELTPSPLVANTSTGYHHGWHRWHRVAYIEGYSPSAYACDAYAASNYNGYGRYYAGNYDPYWGCHYGPHYYRW
jgi:hypothetical protein